MGIHINRLSQNITYKSTEYNARRVPNREKKKKKKRRMIEQSKQDNGNEDRMAMGNNIKQK